MLFQDLALKYLEQEGRTPHEGVLLCFDPGHTTGWAVFHGLKLMDYGQISTKAITPEFIVKLRKLFEEQKPHHSPRGLQNL